MSALTPGSIGPKKAKKRIAKKKPELKASPPPPFPGNIASCVCPTNGFRGEPHPFPANVAYTCGHTNAMWLAAARVLAPCWRTMNDERWRAGLVTNCVTVWYGMALQANRKDIWDAEEVQAEDHGTEDDPRYSRVHKR